MYFLLDCSEMYGSAGWRCGPRGLVAPLSYADMRGFEAGEDGGWGGFVVATAL
jgi:hypothetical protein